MIADIDWEDTKQEMTHYLKQLIRIDTSVGRHGETMAAHYIQAVLKSNELSATVREPIPGKGSLIYHKPGEVSNQSLLLLSHLDVAPAKDLTDWCYLPFSGDEAAGDIWGRGAIDCKGLVVVWLMLVILIQRKKIPLKRGLVFAATADEESGGRWGVEWLLKHTDDFQECRYALNEGGGFSFRQKTRDVYTCQYAEKGHLILDYRIRFANSYDHHFKPQQGQIYHKDSNLINPMLKALLRFHNIPTALGSLLPYGGKVALLKRFSNLPLDYNTLLYNIIELEPLLSFDGSYFAIRVHMDVLPRESIPELKQRIFKQHLISPEFVTEIKVVSSVEPSSSPMDTPLYRSIVSTMNRRADRTTELLPFITPGVTDSRHLRAKGIISYGFFPTPPETDIRLIHRANERISADALVFALQRLYKVVTQFLSSDHFILP
ncbi:peptidase M20 [Desulfosporosinus sp. HMP52]|uniref:M20/M25/M40 family metallo-hydrolase n=1 Tax=Desulfosporosinus sp. HMP52 TaxID=1487923 RepID=UPI00051FE8EF|nr:M20/M25/M40 family metallo-hydrolase [Desulfosporosinus sp. HMP52]KGK89102.1 peptidase M20 [Desulfosporosinus sp. HMP52]